LALLELPSANSCSFSFPGLELRENVRGQTFNTFRTQSACGDTFIEWLCPGMFVALRVAISSNFLKLLWLTGSPGRAPDRWCSTQLRIRRLDLGWLIFTAKDSYVVTAHRSLCLEAAGEENGKQQRRNQPGQFFCLDSLVH
jgi:hypothetical protein